MSKDFTENYNIVVIDDDEFFLASISECLSDYDVQTAVSPSIITKELCNKTDLFILDIDLNLNEDTGYSVCETVRALNEWVPILFLSGMTDIDARLKAYGAGGNDYLPKPFLSDELRFKVESLAKTYQFKRAITDDLSTSSKLIFQAQTGAANLHEINKFVLSSAQCKEEESIFHVFFHTLRALNTDGVLKVQELEPRACVGGVSRLESELIELSVGFPKIQSFGNSRACFNWPNCQLLIRNVNGLIDELAILMDALEVCIERVRTEKQLVGQVTKFEQGNELNKEVISELLDDMTVAISDELLTLGLVSSLDIGEEEKVRDVMNSFKEKIQQRLIKQEEDSIALRETINSMRLVSHSFQQYLEDIDTEADSVDSVELF